jgi:hypothetical protein
MLNVSSITARRLISHRRVHLSFNSLSTVSGPSQTAKAPKEEGTISAIFSSLSGGNTHELPRRFSDLKKEIWRDSLLQSWREILYALEAAAEIVAARGSDVSVIHAVLDHD